MDEIQPPTNHFVALRASSDGQTDLEQFSQGASSTQAINMSISHPELSYPTGISFDGLKQGIAGNRHTTNLIRIPSSSTALPIKTDLQVVTPDLLSTTGTNETHKIIGGGQANYISVAQTMNVNSSPITLSSIDSVGPTANLVSSISTNSGTIQSVPVFQSSSFENCDTMLTPHPQSNQTYLIASPGSILSSNAIHSSDEFVYLPTTASNQSAYTIANSDTQYVSAIPVIQSSSTQPARIILQSNQPNASSHQMLTNNSSPLFLQMGQNTIPTSVQNSSISMNNKGHIIIKSGSTKAKAEPETTTEGVLKILVREGATKAPTPSHSLQHISTDDALRKHVQINLPSKSPKLIQYDTVSNQAANAATPQTFRREGATTHKMYTCPNCEIQFLKSLNLRIHKRDCKKPEAKPEKIPLYMCAFCKAVFKGSNQVYSHFPSCTEHPSYGGKDKAKTGKNSEVQKKLAFPMLFKCQDCDRTFSKERQYTSHLRRCSEVNFNDLSGSKIETGGDENADGSVDSAEDPFADPPTVPTTKRGRGNSGGRRGRPPGRSAVAARSSAKTNVLFEGPTVSESTPGLVVLDNENLVRSTVGLAHTLHLTLDMAMSEGKPPPNALVTDCKGVKGKGKAPQAWSLICSLCQKMFVAKEALACHIMDQHGADLVAAKDALLGTSPQAHTLYRCPLCILHFQSENKILEHMVLRHTGRLQDCYSDLQSQTGTYVCSLCSIVLLTKNVLIEHMSLEHLDELLMGAKKAAKTNERRSKEEVMPVVQADNEDGWDGDIDAAPAVATVTPKVPLNEDNPMECCFCGDYFADERKLHQHYVSSHEMETDSDGCIIDNGIDVDIRVKDTQNLLLIAGSKMTEGTPHKTVLIRKKPKQSFLAVCTACHKSFNRHDLYYRHVQDGCVASASDSNKALSAPEKNFFCRFKECSHLVFNQVKSLFKHMYDAHSITVAKERKTFRNLQSFHQWLEAHSKEKNVKFVVENSKTDNSSISYIQMVCEKFHSSRANQAKEKEAELSKPTKKRLSVRTQRSEDCYARIHLRTEYNSSTGLSDGETQMIYYPEHTHLQEGYKTDELSLKRKRNGAVDEEGGSILSGDLDDEFLSVPKRSVDSAKTLASPYDGHVMCFSTQNGSNANFDFSSSAPVVTTPNILMSQSGAAKRSKDAFIVTPSQASSLLQRSTLSAHNPVILPSNSLVSSAVLMQSGNTILMHNPVLSSHAMQSTDSNKPLLLENEEENNSFILQDDLIMNMNPQQVQTAEPQEYTDEFVLPADEEEWTKLFSLLKDRLVAQDLTDDTRKEAESLLHYQDVIMAISVHNQASIFQKLCAITGTDVESP